MPTNSYTYGPPPDSDSDDCYEGYYFGDDIIKRTKNTYTPKIDVEESLCDAVIRGNLDALCQQIDLLNWNVNKQLRGGQTLLHRACSEGHYDIVEYLVLKKRANVNKQVDSILPLMNACDCYRRDAAYIVEKMVRLLLEKGAVINVSDKYGVTPFMLACKNGYAGAVRLMIKDVSFDAIDNMECTPLFYAVENNRVEIVKILVEAGFNTRVANRKGYTLLQVAEFHGFYDLLEFLPRKAIGYVVPSNYLTYNNLCDHIPRIFLKSECPEYFQEIHTILQAINMNSMLEYFAKNHVSLAEFLTMNDEKLKKLGIKYPLYRMKIMRGILDFHLHHWSKQSIAHVSKSSKENFYEILLLTANHLQHLIIIQSSLKFIAQNQKTNVLGACGQLTLSNFRQSLMSYRSIIDDLYKTTKYLGTFSPESNPLYINYDDLLAQRKRNKVCRILKYTTLVFGISFFVCLKFRHIF